eukprot:scaffold30324_cov60-Phaeocystis_antarctica.AAC.1
MPWGGEVWQACWGRRDGAGLAGNRLHQTRGVRAVLGRTPAARLLHRRHLLLAGRLALWHVVHLHVVADRLRTGRLSGYRRGCCWAIGGVRAPREGRKGLRATAYACAPARQGRACC